MYIQDKPSSNASYVKCRDYMFCARASNASAYDFTVSTGTCTANPPECGAENKVHHRTSLLL